jgi:uncharacterized protein YodC (DUF2158 family)
MSEKLKPGDKVQLKSGGPAMTLVGYHNERPNQVLCQWFKDTDLKSGVFNPNSLEKVDTNVDDSPVMVNPRR